MKYVYALLIVLAVVGALEWHGHHRGYDAGVVATQAAAQKKVDAANAARAAAVADRDATAQTLANVQSKLAEQKQKLELANFYADAAMTERAGLQKQLTAATAARADALRKAAHDSPDCADLARLPVCPAVAQRLWGEIPGTADTSH